MSGLVTSSKMEQNTKDKAKIFETQKATSTKTTNKFWRV